MYSGNADYKISLSGWAAGEITRQIRFNQTTGNVHGSVQFRAYNLRNNDGGISWYNLTPPGMQETGYSVDTFFLDKDHAWVQKQDLEKFPNGGTLYRTSDGGRTWLDTSVPFSRGDLKFLDAETGWMMSDQGVAAGSNAVAVYQITNGGVSWQRTYTNNPNDADAKDSLPLGGIKSDIVPLDANTAWAWRREHENFRFRHLVDNDDFTYTGSTIVGR